MKTKKNKKNTINIVTLGCSKNLVDSEKLLGQLKASQFEVVHDSNSSEARTVIINTCGFINDAKQESIDTILQYANAKEEGLIDNLYVMGCLSERYRLSLKDEIPEIDSLFGVNNMKDIITTVGGDYQADLVGERLITTPSHYAYLKISEGCDRKCSFCAIPLIRGKHISKSIEDLVKEAQGLIRKGIKELILIAQDLTYYGIDIYGKQALADLLTQLSDIEDLKWLRLHYTYPASFPLDVLRLMKERKNICNYLDIPFQHISDIVLTNMRRGINSKQTYQLIETLKKEVPDLTLRTTLMTGHPGEGVDEFNELVQFVKDVKFSRLGVFTYSEEEDTYSASQFKDSIPEEVKKERADALMQLQEQISYDKNQLEIGKNHTVVVDRKEDDYWVGRTEGDSPEVDNEVLIKSNKDLKIGDFYNVKIDSADSFDLFATIEL